MEATVEVAFRVKVVPTAAESTIHKESFTQVVTRIGMVKSK